MLLYWCWIWEELFFVVVDPSTLRFLGTIWSWDLWLCRSARSVWLIWQVAREQIQRGPREPGWKKGPTLTNHLRRLVKWFQHLQKRWDTAIICCFVLPFVCLHAVVYVCMLGLTILCGVVPLHFFCVSFCVCEVFCSLIYFIKAFSASDCSK